MTRKMRLFLAGASGIVLAMTVAGAGQATVLLPGAEAPPDASAAPVATLLATLSAPWTDSTSTMSGTMRSAVYSDPTNVFCAGCLDFMYQVTNNASSTDSIARLSAIDFTGSRTDVGFLTNGSALSGLFFVVNGTVAPQLVDRSSVGDVIGFTFDAPALAEVSPGATSMVLFIETNAKTFKPGDISLIDGGVTTLASFAPIAAVPEPAAWFLMVAGVGAIGASLRLSGRNRNSRALLTT
jgi:hypothetical protein